MQLCRLTLALLVARMTLLLGVALASGCASDPDVEGTLMRDAQQPGSAPQAVAHPPPPRDVLSHLRPGDQVDVLVWGYEDLTRRVVVAPDGGLPYPFGPRLQVGGRSPQDVAAQLRDALRPLVREPVVRVAVAVPAAVRCQVLGEVQRPGSVSLPTAQTTLLEALAAAGGLTDNARRRVLLIREVDGRVYVQGVDHRALVSGAVPRREMLVGDGDTIYVASSRSAETAREARRLADMLAPLLSFQQATILFDSFLHALLHGNPNSTNTIVVPGN